MGDPKRPKKRYATPLHPWRIERIEKEKGLSKNYGLKNKKEIWKFETRLNNFKKQAKSLIITRSKQGEIEKERLIKKLNSIGLLASDAKLDDVLSLNLENLLDRRLQTMVYKNGFARTIDQARQLVIHGHIFLNEMKMTVPSYVVKAGEEGKIIFNPRSNFSNPDHPERNIVKRIKKVEIKK